MPTTNRTWTVDAIEEGVAAVEEDGARVVHVPAWILPPGTREGDVLTVSREAGEGGEAVLRIRVDPAATQAALERSKAQLGLLASRDPGGDIVL